MTDLRAPNSNRLYKAALWLLAWSPALVILLAVDTLRVPVPFEDSWAYVDQYQKWHAGDYGWRDFMKPHNNHPSAVGKSIYFITLHWLDGDVSLLPLLAWLFTVVIAGSVAWVARPLWKGHIYRGPLLVFLANLTIFTAAQGHAWIWDFIYQNFIPGTAFCAAMALLWQWRNAWGALAGAALLSLAATYSFGTGLLAGLVLSPMVWTHFPGASRSRRIFVTAGWLLLMGAAALLAMKGFGEATYTGENSRVGDLIQTPTMVVRFTLVLLGYLLGNGTTMEPGVLCALMGAGLLLVLALSVLRLWQIRKQPGAVSACLPWLLIALYGLGNASLISYGRLRASLISAMAPRYVTFTLFFALGVLMLAAAVAVRDNPDGWFRRTVRRVGPYFAGAFIVMHLVNWNHGWQHMKWEHERMRQDRALLSFAGILPLDEQVMWQLRDGEDSTSQFALFLEKLGKLRSIRKAAGTSLTLYKKTTPLPDKWAWLDAPVLKDGRVYLSGTCGVSKDTISLPEAVLITVQPENGEEQIVNFAIPRQPFDFYENEWLRRQHVSHYFGWSRDLAADRFPKGKMTIRAYGWWGGSRSVRALDREHSITL